MIVDDLEPPTDFPVLLSNVWSAFVSLSDSRGAGFNGPNPISYEQIKAWIELTETPLTSREVLTVKRIDKVYMRILNG